MKKNIFSLALILAINVVIINAQNIAVNTTGTAAASTNMFEVTQASTTANTVGIYSTHTGAITGTGYGLYSTKTGASTTNIGGYFTATGGTNNYSLIVPASGGNVGFGTITPTANLHIVQTAAATGALTGMVYTGAVNTNQTASTEIPAVTLTTAGRQWATGALATQREVLITQPAYSFTGGSTLTTAATMAIGGAPISNTNTTLTNTHALLIQATSTTDGTGGTPTNSFGLTVNAQTGATNNYAAAFLGGNVGMGTTTPTANARLTLKDGHLETDQTTAPTITDHANAGSGASASLAAGSTDLAGLITLNSGTSGWATGTQLTVTFNKSFPTAPIVMWCAANDITGSSVKGWYSGSTTTTLTLSVTDALSGAFTYKFYYFVIGI